MSESKESGAVWCQRVKNQRQCGVRGQRIRGSVVSESKESGAVWCLRVKNQRQCGVRE